MRRSLILIGLCIVLAAVGFSLFGGPDEPSFDERFNQAEQRLEELAQEIESEIEAEIDGSKTED